MKKKLLVIIFSCIFIFSFVSCTENTTINVNVENSSELSSTRIGIYSLIEIGDGLWYDQATRIVYWWNGDCYRQLESSTTPTPYYAPNGFPYRYNPETNTFEEINIQK